VGKRVIKSSDIGRDLRVTTFLNREQLSFNADARRKAADRLIEQTILRGEITSGGYRGASEDDADAMLDKLRQERFAGSDTRLRTAVARYGLTEEELRAQLLWQLTVLRFIDERFRNGVIVTDQDVRSYYDQHLADLKREYGGTAALKRWSRRSALRSRASASMRTLLNPWSRLESAFGSGTCKEHLNEQANENSTTCRNRIGGCLCAADSCGNRGGADGPVPDLRQGKDHQRDRGGYGGKVDLGAFSFDWKRLRAVVTDFVIHGDEPAGSAPFVRAARVEMDLRLFTSVTRVFEVAYLGIDRPEANILVFPDGRTNVPTPKQKTTSDTTSLETVVDLAIGHFELTNGLLRFNSQQQPLDVRATICARSFGITC